MPSQQLTRRGALAVGALVGAGGLTGLAATRGEPSPAAIDGSWKMGRGTPGNTGAAVGSGPAGPVSARWTFEEHLVAGKPPVLADGRLFVGTDQDRPALVALEAATGTELWRTGFEEAAGFPDAAAAFVDDLVVAPFEGLLVGVDAASGDVRWRLRPGEGLTAPVVTEGGVYLSASQEGAVLAVDPERGAVAWKRSVGEYVPAAVAVAGGTVYAVASDEETGSLVALDAATGERRWERSLEWAPRTRPVVAGESLFLTGEGAMYALSLDGERRYRFRHETAEDAGIRYHSGGSAPAVAGGTVYFGAGDAHVYAVDAATGEREWRFRTWGGVAGDPVVAGDTVYVASDDTFVYALDAEDGSRRWEFDTTGKPRGAGGAVVDGLLFVSTYEDALFALEGP